MTLSLVYSILYYYCALSIATGVTSYFTIYRHIIKEILESEASDEAKWMVDSWVYKSAVVAVTIIIAPVMLKSVIFGPSESFVQTFLDRINEKDSE
jgi:hypothetical protein